MERKNHIQELFEKEDFNSLPEDWSREQVLNYVFQRGWRKGVTDGMNQAARLQRTWSRDK